MSEGGPAPPDDPGTLLGRVQDRADQAMWVFTAAAGDDLGGCLAGFATQCSIDPPRFLACVSKANATWRVVQRADALVAHLLSAESLDLARWFGEQTGDEVDKLAAVEWRPGPGGAPVLAACTDWFGGPILDRLDLGDHVGVVVGVTEGEVGPGAGGRLSFRQVEDLEPGHDP